jgi:aryl-alcohol dehydrogenase-like predicted oxidoreductase
LETAFEQGIRYFDTAPMYGWGSSERILGGFAKGRRDQLVIATKAGILPPAAPRLTALSRRLASAASRMGFCPPPGPVPFRMGVFDVPSLGRSVETSLRSLRTDVLDILLLHHVGADDLADEAVWGWLRDLVASGKARSHGVASTREQTARLVAAHGGRLPVVQTASTVLEDSLPRLREAGPFQIVTHSILAGALEVIAATLATDEAFSESWRRRTGVDPGSRDDIAGLLLAEALAANPGGVVLFSTTRPERIAAAARIARDRPYGDEQIAAVRDLAAALTRKLGPPPKLIWE